MPPRATCHSNVCRSGILYVWLERANNLQTKKAGFTRNM